MYDAGVNCTTVTGNDDNIRVNIWMEKPGRFNKKQVSVTNERRCGPYTTLWII